DPEADRLCTRVRCGKTVSAPGHPEVRTLPVRPYTKGHKGPELVAVLQPEHQRMGKRIRHPPPTRPGTGLRDGPAPLDPAGLQKRREGNGRDPGPGLDPWRAAGRSKEPGGIGLQLRQNVRAGPGKDRRLEE